jgi:hypothetical protein
MFAIVRENRPKTYPFLIRLSLRVHGIRHNSLFERGRFIAAIQCRHKTVKYGERCGYRRLIGLGLRLVDADSR